jgi:hypothetical protein
MSASVNCDHSSKALLSIVLQQEVSLGAEKMDGVLKAVFSF